MYKLLIIMALSVSAFAEDKFGSFDYSNLNSRGAVKFTESTANYWGSSLHYNLGLGYVWVIDTETQVTVPITYKASTDLGRGTPDQPESVTFTITVRDIPVFNPVKGETINWSFSPASGTVVVDVKGEVTVSGLVKPSNDLSPGFILTRSEPPVEPPVDPPTGDGYSIVYTRQDRDQTPVDPVDDASNWQHLPDIGSPYRHSASDIIIDDLAGNITVVHDCTTPMEEYRADGTPGNICAALTPRVSPDGNEIIYTVAWGDYWAPVKVWGGPMTAMVEFTATMEELWVYDISKKTNRRLSTGHRDESADWINSSKIVFVSDRANTYSPFTHDGNYYAPNPALQVYTADITDDGIANVKNIAPNVQFAMAPMVASNGDICWVSWEAYGQNGQRGYTHTASNMWWAVCAEQDGANAYPIAGAHGSPYIASRELITSWVDPYRSGEGVTAFRGLRPIVELFKDYIAVDNYYRGNSGGPFGNIFAFSRLPAGVEGVTIYNNYENASVNQNSTAVGSGQYIPPDLVNLTPYGQDQDATPKFSQQGVASGRAGFPAPVPGNAWMYTHAAGWCYEAAIPHQATWDAMGGVPPCHKSIRLVNGLWAVNNPFDEEQSTTIACADPKWHCWDARAISTYQELYGQAEPATQQPTPPGECYLEVVDARLSEFTPIPGDKPQDRISYQGNAVDDFTALMSDGGGLKIELIENWTTQPNRHGFQAQTEYSITRIEQDGSLVAQVPCETPFLMSGVDKDNNVIAIDNMTHSLVSGESRTCYGCHEAHSVERYSQYDASAKELFENTIAGQKP